MLQNDVVGERLVLAQPAHLRGGSWTPGGWHPPNTIESAAPGHWQSEHDWYLAGTSGWVKYNLVTVST